MDFKFIRQIRLAGIVVEVIGLFGYPILFWGGLLIFAGSYILSIGLIEQYFLALEKHANEKQKSEEDTTPED